jgi:hypothetical protein
MGVSIDPCAMSVSIDPLFVGGVPRAQNGFDLFAGGWVSALPPHAESLTAGTVGLFDDPRIHGLERDLLRCTGRGLGGRAVLELGPLEGGHTHLLSRYGCAEIVAVEANALAFLKCLVVKESFPMAQAHFLLGDGLAYLRSATRDFDLGVAIGFLYHQRDPVEAIKLLLRRCRAVYLWTVFYHPSLFEKQPALRPAFGPACPSEHGGFAHTLYPHYYGDGAARSGFIGGTAPDCAWMTAADVAGALRHFGGEIVAQTDEENPFGRAAGFLVVRR